MKKLITAAAILIASFTNAQTKEGTVTYVMTIEGLPAEQAAMMGDMEMKLSFKEKKSLAEVSSMMFSSKTLNDENGSLTLMDQMGMKKFIKTTNADMEKHKEAKKQPKIEYMNDTKTIAGYECKKAIVTIDGKDGEMKSEVWYTDKIPYVSAGGAKRGGPDFSALKGFMMEYTVPQGPMKAKMTAKNVSFDKVPDSVFSLSTEGYTEMKMDEMKGMQGGK